MNIGELEELWSKDCEIRLDDLASDSANIGKLHAKYYKIFRSERMVLKALEIKYRQAIKTKTEYYMGRLSNEEMAEYGWQPFGLIIMKQDLPTYLDADKDLVEVLLKVAAQQEKVNFLESIIKVINGRSFAIKNAVDYLKFTNGQI